MLIFIQNIVKFRILDMEIQMKRAKYLMLTYLHTYLLTYLLTTLVIESSRNQFRQNFTIDSVGSADDKYVGRIHQKPTKTHTLK